MALVLHGELALTKGVPELDGLVTGAGDDLAVVRGEGNGEDVLLVAHEAAGGLAGSNLPEAEGAIPRARECELAVGGDDDAGHEVVVATEGAHREAVVLLGALDGPHHDSLVTGRGKDLVVVLRRGCDGSHPVGVTRQFAAESELFACHGLID